MISSVRTTVDIEDRLLILAKKMAVEKRVSLKALIETGLRKLLGEAAAQPQNPTEALSGLGKDLWKDVDPDRYVREARRGME